MAYHLLKSLNDQKLRSNLIQNLNHLIYINSIEEFIYVLKDFIRTINLDLDVEQEIEELTQKFSFLLKIYNKYEKIFNKLDFVNIK